MALATPPVLHAGHARHAAHASPLPSVRYDIASFGEAVSDPSRVAMLLALMDDRARPASELAHIAGVSASTASAHLQRLTAGKLVDVEVSGRHRYFRLANAEVADAIEALGAQTQVRLRPVAPNPVRDAMTHARTCYQHLAGKLGVAWLDALEADALLTVRGGAIALSSRGMERFAAAGLDSDLLSQLRGKSCVDWSERRHHLGGPLGARLTTDLFTLGWLARRDESRAVRTTSRGRTELARLGIARDLLSKT